MSFVYDEKRATVIAKLIRRTFVKEITDVGLSENGLIVIFANKPTQPVMCCFPLVDTWDKIKIKIQKLNDSDGVCVVCFKNEKVARKKYSVNTCDMCCEFICTECTDECYKTKAAETKNSYKAHLCPVCQTCSVDYFIKVKKDTCRICALDQYITMWDAYTQKLKEEYDEHVYLYIKRHIEPTYRNRFKAVFKTDEFGVVGAPILKVFEEFKGAVDIFLSLHKKIEQVSP